MICGRFAPSPSGRMHLGNAFSALLAWLSARSQNGEMVLRIEDLDPARSKDVFIQGLREDFRWLGLTWDRESTPQSQRGQDYQEKLAFLQGKGLLYPCYCSRDQLHAASAPHASDGRTIYAGTCRNLTPQQQAAMTKKPALRITLLDQVISFSDGLQGAFSQNLQREMGDIILRRADGVAAYQLAVVVDDWENGVNQVVRGRDLLSSTPIQIYLYQLFGYSVPEFYHVPMLLSMDGRRLSKRDGDLEIAALRRNLEPEAVLGRLAWLAGLIPRPEDISLRELLVEFSWDKLRREDIPLDVPKLFPNL